jgi:hypothetical protein
VVVIVCTGSWNYNYLCNQCLSPLTLRVWFPLRWGLLYTMLCDNVLSVTCGRSVVFPGYSGFLHQSNWPPRYSWNIVESVVKNPEILNLQLVWLKPRIITCVWESAYFTNNNKLVGFMTFWLRLVKFLYYKNLWALFIFYFYLVFTCSPTYKNVHTCTCTSTCILFFLSYYI